MFQIAVEAFLGLPGPPSAYFPRLPQKRVLTLQLDVPNSWLVEPVQASMDLDNLKLDDFPGRVACAEFELEALIITGSCLETIGKTTQEVEFYISTFIRTMHTCLWKYIVSFRGS